MSLEMEEAFVESLGKMSNIQSIEITQAHINSNVMDILGERWVAPRSLQKFNSGRLTVFSVLPAWIRSHLSHLCTLKIWVKEVREEDLNILGSLPCLSHLDLGSDRQSRLLPVRADGFPCLTVLKLLSRPPGNVVVQPGALPKLQKLIMLDISLRVAKEEAASNGGAWNMASLPSLRDIFMFLHRCGLTVGEAKHEKAALENTLRTHANRPSFKMYFEPRIPHGT
jgi:disease resistance protein RPM1